MAHIRESHLYTYVLDGVQLTADEATHYATCAVCRTEASQLQQLARDLATMRRNTPSPQALARYLELAPQTQGRGRPSLSDAIRQLTAQLAWDGRHHATLAGARSGAVAGYRLLYVADVGDIELMVESEGQRRHMEGDFLATDTESLPILIQMQPGSQSVHGRPEASPAEAIYEAQSDTRGRFHMDGIWPGSYRLTVTPLDGPLVEIESLEIT